MSIKSILSIKLSILSIKHIRSITMTCTVDEICSKNDHANSLHPSLLRPKEETITPLEKRIHALFQGGFYGGWNASTLPDLVQNPLMYGLGAGIGAGAGLIFRLFKNNVCPSKVNYIQNWKDWLEHPVVMNNITKVAGSAFHVIGISGNTVAGFFLKNHVIVIVEGFAVGTQVGYEATGLLSHLFNPKTDADNAAAEETTPLKKGSTTETV